MLDRHWPFAAIGERHFIDSKHPAECSNFPGANPPCKFHSRFAHIWPERLLFGLQPAMDGMSILGRLADVVRAPFRVAATQNTVRNMEQRLETMRSELLYELRYGRRDEAKEETAEKAVLSPEKLQNAIRLNLGCGHVPLAGFVNVDMRGLPGVDIIAPVDDIPVGPGAVSEIFSSHLLEHFPQEALRRNLLPYWCSLLAPGGVFRAVVPDGEAMLAKAAEGSYPFHDFREVLFGSQDYTGDFHYNMFTPHSLSELLTEAGFNHIAVPARGRRNGRCFEFEIEAVYAGLHARRKYTKYLKVNNIKAEEPHILSRP